MSPLCTFHQTISYIESGIMLSYVSFKSVFIGKYLFFQRYWVFRGFGRISGPNPITQYGLDANMRDLDAALSWKGSGKQYFFKGSRFWRYDVGKKRLDPGYPKHIRLWRGIPNNIDAAFRWRNNALYFFKGLKILNFDTIDNKSIQMCMHS